MPQDIDKMMGITFPNIYKTDACPACEGSGHKVSEAKITVVYDPAYDVHIPSYKLDLRVEHCIHCGGNGVIRHLEMVEPIYDQKLQDEINSRPDIMFYEYTKEKK